MRRLAERFWGKEGKLVNVAETTAEDTLRALMRLGLHPSTVPTQLGGTWSYERDLKEWIALRLLEEQGAMPPRVVSSRPPPGTHVNTPPPSSSWEEEEESSISPILYSLTVAVSFACLIDGWTRLEFPLSLSLSLYLSRSLSFWTLRFSFTSLFFTYAQSSSHSVLSSLLPSPLLSATH